MAKTDIWMPQFIGEYLAETTNLSTLHHGAYNLLKMAAWKNGGQLPNDDEQLAAICRLSAEDWEKTKRLLSALFLVTDSFWVHERLTAEYEKSQRVREAKKQAGALGGRPKSQSESKEKPNGLAKQKQNETPSPSHTHNKSKENKFSSDDMTVAEFIWEGVQRINPNHKAPKLEAWADSVRLMRERDGRSAEDIRALFAWANQHRFWAANVLSPDKLREQYDRLTAQRNQEIQNATNQPIPFNRAAAARKPILDHEDTSWIEGLADPNRL